MKSGILSPLQRVAGLAAAAGLLWVSASHAQGQSVRIFGPPANGEARPPLHARPFTTAGPTGYSPAQIWHAYGVDQLTGYGPSAGGGQTIAIVDAYGSPTVQKDLNAFSQKFVLPPATITIANLAPHIRSDSGWALETSLDVEWAHAIAPGARLLLVVAPSASISDLLKAVDYARGNANVVSMSWGSSEFSGETSYDSHFNYSGVTFTASSGDSGAGVEWPAASPYVVSVGGTSLYLNSDGSLAAAGETAWSGSGGGVSAYEPVPAWQTSSYRSVPDVSYDADPNTGFPVYDSTKYQAQSGWFQVGGTSAGAPQWAALIALANAGRTTSLSATNGALYGLGSTSTTYYRDIISGSNGAFSAGTGYDLVTGLGSPLANALVPALAAY